MCLLDTWGTRGSAGPMIYLPDEDPPTCSGMRESMRDASFGTFYGPNRSTAFFRPFIPRPGSLGRRLHTDSGGYLFRSWKLG